MSEAPENVKVTWRMSLSMAEEFAGNFQPLRDLLNAWADGEARVEPEPEEKTKHRTLMVPAKALKALEKEAKRLSKKDGTKWTAARVAREVWKSFELPE
jgi:hypothetical protein